MSEDFVTETECCSRSADAKATLERLSRSRGNHWITTVTEREHQASTTSSSGDVDHDAETKDVTVDKDVVDKATKVLSRHGVRDAGTVVESWYDELKRIAAAQLRRENPAHTLQPTALVHEAFLRLANQRSLEEKSRSEMLAIGAHLMRRVLVDHARRRKAVKRGGNQERVFLSDEVSLTVSPKDPVDIVMMDDMIGQLSEASERAAKVVELRFFGGLTTDEIADSLEVSPRTIDNDWKFARAWIRRQMDEKTE